MSYTCENPDDSIDNELQRDRRGKIIKNHLNACMCVDFLVGYLFRPVKPKSPTSYKFLSSKAWTYRDSSELTCMINEAYTSFTVSAIHNAVKTVAARYDSWETVITDK